MRKKLLYSFLIVALCLGWYFYPKNTTPLEERECVFCNRRILDYQKVYEDDLALVLYTHKPITPCHFLIIPKRHITRFEELSEKEISKVFEVIKKADIAASKVFNTSSYLLLQKNGLEIGQTVPHVHFHYIARKTGENSSLSLISKMLFEPFRKPISSKKMEEITQTMQSQMQD